MDEDDLEFERYFQEQQRWEAAHREIDPDALGPCGCVDYHMADCDLRTGG